MDAADDVAVFFDFENIFYSVRNTYGLNPDFRIIMDECERHGRVILARSYADWMAPDLRQVPHALYANGIEPIYVPTYHRGEDGEIEGNGARQMIKNSVDLFLCIDAMKALYELPTLRAFVLLTGDRDFIPLVNVLKQHGKRVVVVGVQGLTSAHLAQAADEFVYYHDLVEEELDEPETTAEPMPSAAAQASPEPAAAAWSGDPDAPIEPPRMGVDVVDQRQEGEKVIYSLRDLRSRRVARGVVRDEAHGLWLYAIEQHERGLPGEDEVRWAGNIGLWRVDWRMGRGRYDLVQRDTNGRLHVYYGVTEDGMTGQWEQLVVRNGIHAPRPGNGTNGSREERQPAAPHGDENLWASIINDAERQTNQHR